MRKKLLTNKAAKYAEKLMEAGFTVYAKRDGNWHTQRWFHYSRSVDGRECFATYNDGSDPKWDSHVGMNMRSVLPNSARPLVSKGMAESPYVTADDFFKRRDGRVVQVVYASIELAQRLTCPWVLDLAYEPGREYGDQPHPVIEEENAKPRGIGTLYVPLTRQHLLGSLA